ncbi:MAG TPA: 2'-5' RNA ligase family protein [Gemmatimonadaceae bacterium]
MATPSGIFILGELTGPIAEQIQEIAERHDPKLARSHRPHLTLAGSSGLGPMAADTSVALMREKLEPITSSTAPLELVLEKPERFPATQIVVLPVLARGPIRELHDRIGASGLHFARPRFAFSPHVTLNLYKTLTPGALDALLAVRIDAPVLLDRLRLYFTSDPNMSRLMLELPLAGPGKMW